MCPAFNRPASEFWPNQGLSHIPYGLYNDPDIYHRELNSLFPGPVWNYAGLECEISEPGDYKTTFLGETPIIVVRDKNGGINAFENRCAHRGALLCLERFGSTRIFTCLYHGWSYDLQGDLAGVAFQKGVKGEGGMPPDFHRREHGLECLRVANFAGLMFVSKCTAAPAIEEYLGPEVAERITRVLNRPLKILGYHNQVMRNNWKLYAENVRDSYHASILHMFFTTFKVNRLSQSGGIIVSENGGHHVSYSKINEGVKAADQDYEAANLRANDTGFGLREPALLSGRDEFSDGITMQILSVFPNLVLQQIRNSLVVRQILPKGVDRTEVIWTYYGFADDDADLGDRRLLQSNLVGPAGYISMEDGAIGGFIQRTLAGCENQTSVMMMGGREAESQQSRATETSVRGFWKMYRDIMDI